MSVQLAQKADLMQKFNMRPGVQTKMNTVSNAPKLSSSATNVSTATSSKVGGESSLSSRAASGMALKGDAAPISFNRYANNAYVHSPRVDAKPFMDRNTAIARNSFNRQPNVEFAFGKYSSDPTGTPLRPSDYTKMLNQYNAMYMAQNPYGMLNQMQTNNNPMDLASVAKMSFDIGKNIIGLVKDIKASNTESPKESDIAKLNAAGNSEMSQIQGAKSKSEVQQVLTDIDNKQATLKQSDEAIDLAYAKNVQLQAQTEGLLSETTAKIATENKNIQTQTATITKLTSSIATDSATLGLLERQLASAQSQGSSVSVVALEKEISDLKDKIAKAKSDKETAQKSLDASKDALPGLKQKESNLKNELASIQSDLKSLDKETEQNIQIGKNLAQAETAGNKKLEQMGNQEA